MLEKSEVMNDLLSRLLVKINLTRLVTGNHIWHQTLNFFISKTMLNYVFCKMLIRSWSFQNIGGNKIKGTHFIGIGLRCLKINRNFEKNFFFKK
jgi:hypothetical protein